MQEQTAQTVRSLPPASPGHSSWEALSGLQSIALSDSSTLLHTRSVPARGWDAAASLFQRGEGTLARYQRPAHSAFSSRRVGPSIDMPQPCRVSTWLSGALPKSNAQPFQGFQLKTRTRLVPTTSLAQGHSAFANQFARPWPFQVQNSCVPKHRLPRPWSSTLPRG